MKSSSTDSSICKNNRIFQYCGQSCKYYYLPLFSDSLMDSKVAFILGAENHGDRTCQQISASLIKAVKGYYSHVKIPVDRFHPLFEWTKNGALNRGLGVVLQVCTSFLQNEDFFSNLAGEDENFEIEWIFDSSNRKIEERFSQLSRHFRSSHLSIPVHRHLDWNLVTDTSFFKAFLGIHLYFDFQKDVYDSSNGCRGVHKLLGLLRKNFPRKDFLPPKGVDLWIIGFTGILIWNPVCCPALKSNPKIQKSGIPLLSPLLIIRIIFRWL